MEQYTNHLLFDTMNNFFRDGFSIDHCGGRKAICPCWNTSLYAAKANSWEKLPRPPFLRPDSKFFQDPQFRAYVVIGNKIHVSTSSSSFTFDTATKKWTPCTLFDEEDHHLELRRCPWFDIRYPTHFEWMKYPLNNEKDKQGCGFPFDFDGGAVMYDGDVLICLVPSEGVVAYKLVGGEVMDTHVLELGRLGNPT
ncbi:hypothetical protein TEA_020529 [Camellia sinensis var. sinensis]|uniref:Uncharacterized protein n=1 Tax=Camellia sinensis var. sinensis TaxID=542762 RepID=A0A4S4EWW0_CAMSN|nr:hypothetical protein TEA_020529 [Camellia sinensis var. sinensis]